MPARKIALFVHDLYLEIGHANALIETINNLPAEEVKEIVVVAYQADDLDQLFFNHHCPKKLLSLGIKGIKPFLLKAIYYHFISWLYARLILRDFYKIGVGIAAFSVDLVNIQFVHKQWKALYFFLLTPRGVKYWYKKLLFAYYEWIENILFHRPKVKFLALSGFVHDYCKKEFQLQDRQIRTIYSGVNLQKFTPLFKERSELILQLSELYPQLESLDPKRPIYLFIGAFERKGLPIIQERLSNLGREQLIIIGKPESSSNFSFVDTLDIFYIEFTNQLPLFYSLADAFLFASWYEPFGLVIIEAAAMGCELFVTRKNVGAVELLEDMPGIHIFNDVQDFTISPVSLLSIQQRQLYCQQRKERLAKYNWQFTAAQLLEFIQQEDF